jgi:hypothetical protein
MTEQTSRTVTTVVAASLLGAVATVGAAQEAGGPLVSIGVSNSASFEDDSLNGTRSTVGSRLSFGLSSTTRTHSFSAATGGQFLLDDGDAVFDNRFGTLAYSYSLNRSEIGVELAYREIDIDGGTVIDDILIDDSGNITGISLIADEGTRQNLDARVYLRTGDDMPFGTETTLRFQQIDYQGLISGSFNDSETLDARTVLRFDLSPQVQLRVTGQLTQTEAEDTVNTERTTARLGVSARILLDPLWTVAPQLQFRQVEEETTVGLSRVSTTRDEVDLGLTVTRAFRNGTLQANYLHEDTEIGTRDRLIFTREMALANGGEISLGLGAFAFEGEGVFPVLQLGYGQETRNGAFALQLGQTALIQSSTPAIRTAFAADYRHQLSELSSLLLNGSYAAQDVVGTSAGDQESLEIGIGYSHILAQDWALSTRLSHRIITETGVADRDISTLSLSLERQFTFRP